MSAKYTRRASNRLMGYNYSNDGMYFITICARNRECIFGRINEKEMRLNEYGEIIKQSWRWLEEQYDYVQLDKYVIMPNHLHGIIIINNNCRGGSRTAPTTKTLGRLIGAFKTVSTKYVNCLRKTPTMPIWQRSFYDHIIRSEKSLHKIRKYIVNNAVGWQFDIENIR